MDRNDYDKMVDDLLNQSSSVVFANHAIDHVAYVFEKLLFSAQKNIRMLTGSFAEIFYNRKTIIDALRNAALKLNQEGSIKIITTDKCSDESIEMLNNIFNRINTDCGKNIIEYIPAIFDGKKNEIHHFVIVDNKRYRIEEPHEPFSPDNFQPVKARVCFNDEVLANDRAKLFDNIWDSLKTMK